MACLREQAPDGRIGTVSCDEEGCLFRPIAALGDKDFDEKTSEADCLLQLRFRAGDSERGVKERWAMVRLPSGESVKVYLTEQQYRLAIRGILTHISLTEDGQPSRLVKRDGRPVGLPTESGGDEAESGDQRELPGRPDVARVDKFQISIDGVNVVANRDQEQRIRNLTDEQLINFRRIFGGK